MDGKKMTREEAEELMAEMEASMPPEMAASIPPERLKLAREMMIAKMMGDPSNVFDEIEEIVDGIHSAPEGEERAAHGFLTLKVSRFAAPSLYRIIKLGLKASSMIQGDLALMTRMDTLYQRVLQYKDRAALEEVPMLVASHGGLDLPIDERTGGLDRAAIDLDDPAVLAMIDYSRRACLSSQFAAEAELSVLPRQIRQSCMVADAERGQFGGLRLPSALIENIDTVVQDRLDRDNALRAEADPDFEPRLRFGDPDFTDHGIVEDDDQ